MNKIKKDIPFIDQHDENGFWGKHGGNFIGETLKQPVEDLTKAFEKLQNAMLNASKSNNLLPKN